MFERRRALAQERLSAAAAAPGNEDKNALGGDDAVSDRVSAAVVQSLDAKLESIDDLIARLEIEEGEVLRLYTRACVCLCVFRYMRPLFPLP